MNIDNDKWYEHEDSETIYCGECVNKMIAKTKLGEFTGDEAVTASMVRELEDAEIEPYQCDDCLTQNAAYDELGEDDDS